MPSITIKIEFAEGQQPIVRTSFSAGDEPVQAPALRISEQPSDQQLKEVVLGVLKNKNMALPARDIGRGSRMFRRLSSEKQEALLQDMVDCGLVTEHKTSRTMKYRAN